MPRRGNNEGSIYKRTDGRWAATVDLGWESGKRKRKSIYAATRREVADKLRVALTHRQHDEPLVAERTTVLQLSERYLATGTTNLRPSTLESYRRVVALYIVPTLGHVRLAKLSPQTIQQQLITHMTASGLSPRSVQYAVAILRRMLNVGERWGILPRGSNPAKFVEMPTVRAPKIEPFNVQESREFITAVGSHRLGALFITAIATGLRQGELLGLRWDDIDLGSEQLTVRNTLVWSRADRHWSLSAPKTERSRRTLWLPPVVLSSLRQQQQQQIEERLKAGAAWQQNNLVFATPLGGPLDGANVTHALHKLLAAAGLRRIRFHDLRHAAASLLLAHGLQMREIMEFLGHSQIALTANLYTHLLPAMKQDAARQMEAALTGS